MDIKISLTRRKYIKRTIFLSFVLLMFGLCACGHTSKEDSEKKQNVLNNTSDSVLSPTPTKCPDTPPYYVMLDGTRLQRKEYTDEDLSEYEVGSLTYTGDLYTLPNENGQTNMSGYVDCKYAEKDGTWYLLFEHLWYRLGADE